MIRRRHVLTAAAGGTLAAVVRPRKPRAAPPSPLHGLVRFDPPKPVPDIAFFGADGSKHHFSDFKGRGMVVNLWATWCMPCVEEMPSLAALSKTLASSDIAVMPISSDRGGASAVSAWFGRHDITSLPVLLDPHGDLAHAFGVRGIPTTFIIDTANRQVASLEGAADWSAPDAEAAIKKLVAA
ncbi:MAG TPA: TlpA disulfide reductase family protein [Rhodopila sp.]|uniref:TlpA family protein disulfide reductase n=1 Tax=Rhodopila sp. TaxID=2480087 RepID=UPI002CF89E6D|nr:TlpA disulfide reductase family protein [Rhodopila sp.]HVY17147.1 TlpA disulfide reductase family protein [Rhodopila sp.]